MKKWQGDIVFVLLIAALVSGWVSLYPHPKDSFLSPLAPPIELDTEPRTYASPEGNALAFRLYEPEGEPKSVLIFLHDTLLHSAWYAEFGHRLAAEGIAVYTPDRRGWGRSSGERCQQTTDKAALVEDMLALVAAAQARYPQKKIFLGGHGRGAGIVLSYLAAKKPAAGVVLVAPYMTDDQPDVNPAGWQKLATVHPIESWLARSGLAGWAVWHYNWPASMVESDPLLITRCSISCERETVPDDVAAAYRAATAPLLYVQGQDDRLFDVDKSSETLAFFASPDKQLVRIPDADYLGISAAAVRPIAAWMGQK